MVNDSFIRLVSESLKASEQALHLKIAHINSRSLRNKFSIIEPTILNLDLDLIIISETRIDFTIEKKLPGY